MKKLQIMAWVLSALLLTGCSGSGTPTNTDNLPQTSATDASEATTTQNGNEYASEETAQGQDEKSGASDAAHEQVTEKDSSAGDEKTAAGTTPAQENGASAPSKAGSTGNGASDSAGNSSSKPAGNSPSAPAGSGTDAADSWDTPIRCSSKTEDVLERYIRDDLTYYKDEEGCTVVWIWAEPVGDGQYELFIGRG